MKKLFVIFMVAALIGIIATKIALKQNQEKIIDSSWVIFDEQKEGMLGILPDFKYPGDWHTSNFAGGTKISIYFSDTRKQFDKTHLKKITDECWFVVSYDGSADTYTNKIHNSKTDKKQNKKCDSILTILSSQIPKK